MTRAVDRESLRRLSRCSDALGLLQLSGHLSLLCATGALVWASRGTLWLIPAVVLHGMVLDFLFCPLHETIHRTAFASPRVNAAVSWVCGWLLLLPPEYFRLFHFAHHRFTQDPARDPELAQPSPAGLASYLWRATGFPNWGKRLEVTLRHALTGQVREPFVPPAKRGQIVREARILWSGYLAVIGASLYFGRADALIYWILPAIAGQPFLRLFLAAEHIGCAQSGDMCANTRTTYTNAAFRLLTWQMSYHAEHHNFPSVPFHSLAKVNAIIRDSLKVTAPGYLALQRDLLRKFRTPAGRGNEAVIR